MTEKKETDIGLNTLGGKIVTAGLTGTGVMAAIGPPAWLIAVPIMVTLVGMLICTRSFWWRR